MWNLKNVLLYNPSKESHSNGTIVHVRQPKRANAGCISPAYFKIRPHYYHFFSILLRCIFRYLM